MLTVGPFSLDEEAGRLWCGSMERQLRAKSFAVFRLLLRRRGRLVTKEELFRACWPNTAVSPTVLRTCIMEVRALLAEDTTGAAAIESLGRRGYRLVLHGASDGDAPVLIGRDRELGVLRRALGKAESGMRQVVFVSGEPGLGK